MASRTVRGGLGGRGLGDRDGEERGEEDAGIKFGAMIRTATEEDIPELLAIYNDVILTTTAIYSEEPVSLENRLAWFKERVGQGFPVLVAVEGDAVVGFSSFGGFRASPGYKATVELSVHVHVDLRGRGVGRSLVKALFPYAAAAGKHVMIAVIDAENEASIHLHESLGFRQAGHFQEVGFKFGRWLDLVFLQRPVDQRTVLPDGPATLATPQT